jgi:hypothetical protein
MSAYTGTASSDSDTDFLPSGGDPGDVLSVDAGGQLVWMEPGTAGFGFVSHNPATGYITSPLSPTLAFPDAGFRVGTATPGSITGSAGALTIAAAGTNQAVTINGSGTGDVLLNPAGNGKVGIGTLTPAVPFQLRESGAANGTLPAAYFYGNVGFGRRFIPNGVSNNVVVYIGNRTAPAAASDNWDLAASSGNLYSLAAEAAMKAVGGNNDRHVSVWAQVFSGDDGSSRTLSEQYGVFVAAPEKAGTLAVTTAYGIYVAAPTTGGTNWGIYNDGDLRQTGQANFTEIRPINHNSYAVGSTGNRFTDLFLSGIATIGSLVADSAGPHAIGGATDATTQLWMRGSFTSSGTVHGFRFSPTLTAGVGSNFFGALWAPTLVEAGSGVHALMVANEFGVPTITSGAATVTDAATVRIAGATGATVTGGDYALWVDAGTVRFDGGLNMATDAQSISWGGGNSYIYGSTAGNYVRIGTAGSDRLFVDDEKVLTTLPIKPPAYTVATLPTGAVGMHAYVTDATAPTYLGALTGGGAVTCPVFHNGAAWVSH